MVCADRKRARTRLRAAYGTTDFWAEYTAAVAGQPLADRSEPKKGSLTWLWDRYRESGAWAALSVATRRQRENIATHVLAASAVSPLPLSTKCQSLQDSTNEVRLRLPRVIFSTPWLVFSDGRWVRVT